MAREWIVKGRRFLGGVETVTVGETRTGRRNGVGWGHGDLRVAVEAAGGMGKINFWFYLSI